jgi:DNA primase
LLPEGEDPDTPGPAGRPGRVRAAAGASTCPWLIYLFAELRAQADPNTLAGRARLAELARPLLEKLPEGHFRDLMVERSAPGSATGEHPSAASVDVDLARHNLQLTRTPLRKAIALLLYRPELAQRATVATISPSEATTAGREIVGELIGGLHANPQLSIAALLERYRDTREGRFWSGWPLGGWRYRRRIPI